MNLTSDKITSTENFLPIREKYRRDNRRLVCTNGCFDLLHAGHLQSLALARAAGDALLVLVNADKSVRSLKTPDRPLVAENDRAQLLAALAIVDHVIIFDAPRCDEILAKVKPDIYVKSADYTRETLNPSERDAVENSGGKIIFTPLVAGLSTTNLIKKIRRSDPEKVISAAFALIKNSRQEILLVKNQYERRIRWGLPGGGQLRSEKLNETAIRETREETGLIISPTEYVGLIERVGDRLHLHCHQFAAVVTGGELRIDPREEHVVDAAYFSAEKILAWNEEIMGRKYLHIYATSPEKYPRYAAMTEDEE